MCINLGFIIPYADQTDVCANAVTPSDMYSSTSCAFSGAFILAGGLTAVMWVLVRALSMHLQICWDITPGRRFYYLTQLGGWAIPAAVFTAAMSATGVSFRFGPGACHINHTHSIADFWAWLLVIAGCAITIQFGTMVFCFNVYLRNIWADEEPTTANTDPNIPSYTSSQRATTARAIYRRLKRVLWLQWRGLALVTLVMVDVVFFAVVFVYLDKSIAPTQSNIMRATPWVLCLIKNPSNPGQCLALGQKYLVSQSTIGAVLILLASIGVILSAILLRWSFFVGWKKWIMNFFGHGDEFESIESMHHGAADNQDGKQQHGPGGAMFEMQQPTKEYETGEQPVGEPSVSSFGTPTEQYHTPGQYPYQTQVTSPHYNPNMAHSYFNPVGAPTSTTTISANGAAIDQPQMPGHAFTHPNPNIARIRANQPPLPTQGPNYGYYEAPVGYAPQAPPQAQHPPQQQQHMYAQQPQYEGQPAYAQPHVVYTTTSPYEEGVQAPTHYYHPQQ
ncbi:hypothetical protein ANO11243_040080 [Dothideomycetidae sp. 11243]|nr:hypothetical protein ANO11243_040080 [fungal sp. No.11243]